MKDRPKANQMRFFKICIFIKFLIQVGMISTAFSFSPNNIIRPTNNYDRLSKRRKQSKQRVMNSLLILKQKNRSDDEKEEEIPKTASEARGKSNNINNKNSKNMKNSSAIQNQSITNSKKSQTKSKSSSTNKKKNSNSNSYNNNKKKNNNLINLLANPYEAGVQLRQTIDRTLNSNIKKPLTSEQKSIYYLDDRFLDSGASSSSGSSSGDSMSLMNGGRNSIPSEGALGFLERKKNSFNDLLDNYDYSIYEDNDYVPEVLVIGKIDILF